jgi:hypothetical protein
MALALLTVQVDAAAGGGAPIEKGLFEDLFSSSPPPPPPPDDSFLMRAALPMFGLLGFGETSPPAPPPSFLNRMASLTSFGSSSAEPESFSIEQEPAALEMAAPFQPQAQGQPFWQTDGLFLAAETAPHATGSLTLVAGKGSILGVAGLCLAAAVLILTVRRRHRKPVGAPTATNLV